jgi:hypothetical protein
MRTSFTTTVSQDDNTTATGLQVPEEVVNTLGSGKKPKVKVSLNGYTYRSTVAVMGGAYWIPLSAEHRNAAGIKAGDLIEINLELDTEPRTVEVPPDLSAALQQGSATAAFDSLSYTLRKEYVRQVESAKAQETRERRIAGIVAKLNGG